MLPVIANENNIFWTLLWSDVDCELCGLITSYRRVGNLEEQYRHIYVLWKLITTLVVLIFSCEFDFIKKKKFSENKENYAKMNITSTNLVDLYWVSTMLICGS